MMERTTIDIDGPVSVIEYGGSGPLAVCVHGLEGSAYNWRLIADDLTKTHTVVAPDLPGFGYTDPAGRSVTVDANAEVVAELIRHYGDDALVIGNSMGGLISILLAARQPETVRALVLVNPASPVARWRRVRPLSAVTLGTPLIPLLARPLINAYRASHTPEVGVEYSYRFVTADPSTVASVALDDALEVATLRRTQPWSASVLTKASRSIAPYVLTKGKYTSVVHGVSQPTLLIHGAKDDVIQMESAVWVASQRPDWTAVYFEDLGHVPMIEAPQRFMSVFRTWEDAITGEMSQ